MLYRAEDAIEAMRAQNEDLRAKIQEMEARIADGFATLSRNELALQKTDDPPKPQPPKKIAGGLRYRIDVGRGETEMESWVKFVSFGLLLSGFAVACVPIGTGAMRWLWAVALFLVLFGSYIIYRALPREEIDAP